MVAFEDKELAVWLEALARDMLSSEIETAAVIYKLKSGDVQTGYLRAGMQEKATFAFAFQQDAILDTLEANPEILREILEGGKEDAET